MSTTLAEVITAVRLKHPAYSSDNVPNRVLAEAYTSLQRRLVMLATQKIPTFLSQHFGVVFAFASANLPGTVGANTSGGLPGGVDASGVLEPNESTIGIAPTFDLASAVVLAAGRVITVVSAGVSTTTLTFQGSPGWTVNGFQGMYLDLTDGPGQGAASLRQIASNTAGTITVSGLYDTSPAANQTVGRVVALPATATDQLGVATALPALGNTTGYLVKLDSTGTPYLDLTSPVVTQFEQGIPLPSMHKLLGATVLWSGVNSASSTTSDAVATGPGLGECIIIPYQQRHHAGGFPAVYTLGTDLFLCGSTMDWTGILGLDIRYSPIPPAFGATATTLQELFLLPDSAYDCLVAHGGVVAARYAVAKGVPVDVGDAVREAEVAEAVWLRMVGQSGGGQRRLARKNR